MLQCQIMTTMHTHEHTGVHALTKASTHASRERERERERERHAHGRKRELTSTCAVQTTRTTNNDGKFQATRRSKGA